MNFKNWILAICFVSLWQPLPLFACAVCGFGLDETRDAFVFSTILLSLVPVLLMGALVGYLWWKSRNSEVKND